MRRDLAVTAVCVTAALALAACGTTNASHVVGGPGAHGAGAAAGSSAVPTTAPAPGATVQPTSSSSSIDDVLSPAVSSEVQTELSQLDGSLGQADSDIADPQGDS